MYIGNKTTNDITLQNLNDIKYLKTGDNLKLMSIKTSEVINRNKKDKNKIMSIIL